ncbi:MAG: LysM domain-containing protein [Desulfobacterales bacterium]|nr:LysM domain-containing protein [Desulfobacterales bacterium]MDJ0989171.1 LysM domain-containing protein [Desulfobacterales bacterium]
MGMRFESDHEEEELSQYDAYTALDDRKGSRKAVYFYVAAGLGLLILVLAFVMLGSGAGRQEFDSRIELIEKRLDDMEFRLGNIVQSTAGGDLASLQKADQDFGRRFDALERKLEGRLNQMQAALTQLEKRPPPAPPQPQAKPVKAPPPPKTGLHTVQKGETLYQISRKYGMRVDDVRKLNGIGKDFKIYPGQKLKVTGKP